MPKRAHKAHEETLAQRVGNEATTRLLIMDSFGALMRDTPPPRMSKHMRALSCAMDDIAQHGSCQRDLFTASRGDI